MEYVCLFVLLIFALFGFSEFLHILKLFIAFPRAKINSRLIVRLKNSIAEKQLLHTCEQFCWYGKRFANDICFECEDLESEVYERCKKIAARYGIKI